MYKENGFACRQLDCKNELRLQDIQEGKSMQSRFEACKMPLQAYRRRILATGKQQASKMFQELQQGKEALVHYVSVCVCVCFRRLESRATKFQASWQQPLPVKMQGAE